MNTIIIIIISLFSLKGINLDTGRKGKVADKNGSIVNIKKVGKTTLHK